MGRLWWSDKKWGGREKLEAEAMVGERKGETGNWEFWSEEEGEGGFNNWDLKEEEKKKKEKRGKENVDDSVCFLFKVSGLL